MSSIAKLKELALAAGAGTFRGDWESTGVVIAAPDEGGMHYLLEACHGKTDTPALAFVEAADPNMVLALCELAGAASAVHKLIEFRRKELGSLSDEMEAVAGPLAAALDKLKGA